MNIEVVQAAAKQLLDKIYLKVEQIDFENLGESFFLFKVQGIESMGAQNKMEVMKAFNRELSKMNFKADTLGKALILFTPFDFKFEPRKFPDADLEALVRGRGMSMIVNYYKPFCINPNMKEGEIDQVIEQWENYEHIAREHIRELNTQKKQLEKHRRLIQRKKDAMALYHQGDKIPAGKILLLPLQAMVSHPAPDKQWKGGMCSECDKPVWIAPSSQKVLEQGAIGMCPPCGYYKAGLK